MSKNKAIADISADNAVLISYVSLLKRGDVATYAEHFTKWLGRTIRNASDLASFGTVKKKLQNDYGIVLSVVRGEGYKLLTDTETLADDSENDKARRCSKRRKKALGTIDITKLNEQEKISLVCKMTQAHLIEEACKEKSLKKLAAAANGATTPLALGHALEALKKNL